jgi:ABC-type multidrug transport system fused ATPase/permease subunit
VLIKEEGRYRGAFEGKVYSTYLMSMGTFTFFSILITLVTVTVARIMVDWVLAAWSVDSLGLSIPLYAGVFSAVSVGAIALTLANAMLWAHGGLVAAKGLHAGMVARVLRAPISFFDTTPLGRIVNRFTSDVGILDKDLPTAMASASTLVLRILGTLVIQAVVLPWTLLGTLPLAALYVGIFLVYRASARELKRIDLASKSLASAVLVESAQGQSTIAAWGAGPRFEALLFKSVDENNRAYWAGNSLNRWLGLRLDWLGSALLGVIVGVAVGTPSQSNPGLVGLAITYALAIAGLLNWAVRSATECETLLSSAQRVLEYTSLVVEAPPIVPSHRPPVGWPTVGEVVITNLTARHREGLQPCLKGVSVRVPGGSKVGVVGRTGSGKTSLTLALFRIIEASEGSVEIDGLDISKMGLDDLRGALSIVPQDATLFTGTVGTCLDPLGVFSEKELVAALAGVHFSTVSPASKVEEGGLNFSQGERQLLCLARALLRKSRVVVLDESTASMDSVLDTQLQKTLKTSLSGATVFVVAHRLETVADADYILVMDAGKVAEFGPPKELAAKVGGIYAQLLLKE